MELMMSSQLGRIILGGSTSSGDEMKTKPDDDDAVCLRSRLIEGAHG